MTIDSSLTFSVIINTTDRADSLRILLQALEYQTYDHFEVVVVVGPTKDDTLAVLADYDRRVRVLRCSNANLSQSRNIGLQAARGDIVAYIDDDAVPCRRWLEQLASLFNGAELDATGGVVYLVHPRTPRIQHRIGIISSLGEQVDVRDSRLEQLVPPGDGTQWLPRMMGTNMAFRRDALLKIGGFDEFYVYIAEEGDALLRLANAGNTIHPVREAPVYHVPASSRNRTVFTHEGRWWLQTRSGIYFAIKNGRAAGDSLKHIVIRSLHLIHGHWLWYRDLLREGHISLTAYVRMSAQEIRGALEGILNGVFRARQLMSNSERTNPLDETTDSFVQFKNNESATQPAVDPVNGRRLLLSTKEKPLRICLLSGLYPPEQYDGIGRHTNLMAQGLFELGHEVHVIARGAHDAVSFYDGAYVHRITYNLDRYDRYAALPNLHHTLNYSHAVHETVKRLRWNDGIQIVDSPLWQLEGLVTAVSGELPVIVRLQTALRQVAAIQWQTDEQTYAAAALEHELIRRAAGLVPNSQATLTVTREAYPLDTKDVPHMVIPHGIVPVPDDAIRPFREDNDGDNLTVLYVGRLERRKGITGLFDAIPTVLEQVPTARFIIAGSDNSRHDGFYDRHGMTYPAFFRRRHGRLAANVRFVGEVSDETLQKLYQSCDLFVAPSLYESFGLVYLEAMNYAKPVVGCNAGGVPEVVDDGVTGRLVEPEAPAALADAIVTLLQSPELLRNMGMAGRERLLSHFTHLQMARGFARVYRAVLQQTETDDQ